MITGQTMRDAILSGANNIANQRTRVDELNVFPVPDGDTGTNMSMTIGAARAELEAMPDSCTVAEAIERKSSIALDKGLLTALRKQNLANTQAVNTLTTRLNETIEKGIAQLYGSDRAKITDEQVKVVSDAKKKDFDPSLVDPLNIGKIIDEMIEKIEGFETEVNFSLSEINSRTEITVQY